MTTVQLFVDASRSLPVYISFPFLFAVFAHTCLLSYSFFLFLSPLVSWVTVVEPLRLFVLTIFIDHKSLCLYVSRWLCAHTTIFTCSLVVFALLKVLLSTFHTFFVHCLSSTFQQTFVANSLLCANEASSEVSGAQSLL